MIEMELGRNPVKQWRISKGLLVLPLATVALLWGHGIGPARHAQQSEGSAKSAAPPQPEADAVRFDAALTVCVMRYISDLHIGKVNPKHFDFGLDVEAKKYNLPEFLNEHVVDAPDVAGVLAQVEPPYPGYRRTMQALHTYLEVAKEYDEKPLPARQKTIAPG